jgi:hypothetical protein
MTKRAIGDRQKACRTPSPPAIGTLAPAAGHDLGRRQHLEAAALLPAPTEFAGRRPGVDVRMAPPGDIFLSDMTRAYCFSI